MQIYINQNEWQAYVLGTICPPHQIPCDSMQRRLLSIKMAVFMDGVCKIQLLSTKMAVFMDKM